MEEIKKKPVKDLTNHEFYLRYKEIIKQINKKNYKKYDFSKYVAEYQKRNKDKIKDLNQDNHVLSDKEAYKQGEVEDYR